VYLLYWAEAHRVYLVAIIVIENREILAFSPISGKREKSKRSAQD